MPQQIVHRANAEVLLELAGALLADDEIEPVIQRDHGYSTPINKASPRWPVW